MVLQRDVETKIWGWAAANESIVLEFDNSTYQTTADSLGNWDIIIPAIKAGGPYKMKISATCEIHLHSGEESLPRKHDKETGLELLDI